MEQEKWRSSIEESKKSKVGTGEISEAEKKRRRKEAFLKFFAEDEDRKKNKKREDTKTKTAPVPSSKWAPIPQAKEKKDEPEYDPADPTSDVEEDSNTM